MIQAYEEPVYFIDMITSASVGASKGGGVGALVLSAQSTSDYRSIEILINAESFKHITDSNIIQFAIDYPLGSIRFINSNDIALLGAGEFSFKLERLDDDILDESAKNIIGTRPVVKLDLTVDGKQIGNPTNDILFELPYTPSYEEDINLLTLYRVDDSGRLVQIRNSMGKLMTKINDEKFYLQALISEPAIYAIGYKQVAYNDVSGWCQPYVNFSLARGIMNDSNGLFSPDDSITRGDLAYYLANMSEQDISLFTDSVLADVSANHPYVNAIAWAYSTGIIDGYEDGTFRPDQIITRQELAAMLYRYTQVIANTYMPRINIEKSFKDDNLIEEFAKEAVSCLQQAGVIDGKGNNYFEPLANVTRAECAKMITTVMNGIMDGKTKFIPIN